MAEATTSSAGKATPVTEPADGSGPLLTILLLGVFMAILDVAIVNVAVPKIGTDLDASGAEQQLVIDGYIISYAVLLITGARLGALFGRRRMFLAGVALFTLASLACGVAWTALALIIFRFVQGVGAALMVPQVISMIQLNFSGDGRARALGRYGATISGGAIVGQVLGGVLVAADLFGTEWRLCFLVNVPIGIGLLLAGRRTIPRDTGTPGLGLDLVGLVTLMVAVFALVLPLVLGHQLHWPAWTWACLALFVLLIPVFTLFERRTDRGGGSPLIHGKLLRAPGMVVSSLAILAALGGYGGILFLLTVYVQSGLGHNALVAGLVFLPSAVMFAVSSLNWRKLPAHWHRRMIPAGLALSAVAFVGLALSTRSGDINVGMEVSIGLFGAGMGLAFSTLFAFAVAHVPAAHAADASGVLTTVNQLGQVIGVAAYGSIYLALASGSDGPSDAAMTTSLAMAAGAAIAALIALGLPADRKA
ncbi:MFS transporter [Streptomyces sp. GbtcB6]|uniref:MFS transporter n=1 Tax=Streptomyces sp. GbtcB6 TaxID=2824751 RepID=UPI0020C5F557|nr:MFS transporter [Streptomyces sp. GbtcB6]